jgi:hypothetical protein
VHFYSILLQSLTALETRIYLASQECLTHTYQPLCCDFHPIVSCSLCAVVSFHRSHSRLTTHSSSSSNHRTLPSLLFGRQTHHRVISCDSSLPQSSAAHLCALFQDFCAFQQPLLATSGVFLSRSRRSLSKFTSKAALDLQVAPSPRSVCFEVSNTG